MKITTTFSLFLTQIACLSTLFAGASPYPDSDPRSPIYAEWERLHSSKENSPMEVNPSEQEQQSQNQRH